VDTPEGAKMRQELFMAKRKRRSFTLAFKADAAKLVQVVAASATWRESST
jgi:hypothetical protein